MGKVVKRPEELFPYVSASDFTDVKFYRHFLNVSGPVSSFIQGYLLTIVVFTPHVLVYFWPYRHNIGDIELKFCILSRLTYRLLATKFEISVLNNKCFLYLTFL